MHDEGVRVGRTHPARQTIRLLGADARDGEQAGRFVEDDEPVIEVKNGWKHGKTPDRGKGCPRKRETNRGDR